MKDMLYKRLILAVLTILFVAVLSFSFTYFSPGNTAALMIREKYPGTELTPENIKMFEERLGLNKPFHELFFNWATNAIKGDLGKSIKTSEPVVKLFFDRFKITAQLIVVTTGLYMLIGITLGFLSAFFKDTVIDKTIRLLSVFNQSTPSFWLGLFALWLFSVKIKGFNIFGYNGLQNLLVPAFVLAFGHSGGFIRVLRGVIIEIMESPYIAMAKATGMPYRKIFTNHIIINTLSMVVTLVLIHTVSLIGGTLIIENIFGLPGIGLTLTNAINLKDFPIISGFSVIIGVLVTMINFLSDVLYAAIDPKVRY